MQIGDVIIIHARMGHRVHRQRRKRRIAACSVISGEESVTIIYIPNEVTLR